MFFLKHHESFGGRHLELLPPAERSKRLIHLHGAVVCIGDYVPVGRFVSILENHRLQVLFFLYDTVHWHSAVNSRFGTIYIFRGVVLVEHALIFHISSRLCALDWSDHALLISTLHARKHVARRKWVNLASVEKFVVSVLFIDVLNIQYVKPSVACPCNH